MNMISTAFPIETDAPNKNSKLVSNLVNVWEKKNSKTARAGGVSLMALSLAACGAEDDTPFAQADIDAATAPLAAAVIVAEAATVAAQTQAATAVVAQAQAETAAATALVAQAQAEASAAAAQVAAATATVGKAASDAALVVAQASLATAQASLAVETAAKVAAEASLATETAALAVLQTSYDVLTAPANVSLASAATETLAGTAGNDTFSGGTTFYDVADNIVDGSTADSDTYNLTVNAANASVDNTFTGGGAAGAGVEVGPNLTNVETVNITATSVAALEVSAQNMTGVDNLTITKADVTVGGATIAGNKAVVVFGVDAADVAIVTTGAGTTAATVIQATTAGITVNADTASGSINVTGAATINAAGAGAGDTLTHAVLGNAVQDAKAVVINTAANDVVVGAFTGTINVNAPTSTSVDLAGATGGATIVAAGEAGTVGAGTTGIDITGVDASGVNITTSYAGTSAAPGTIDLTGTAATNDVATVSATGFTQLDNDTNAVDTLNLSGNGAAATYVMTGIAATTIAASGSQAVSLSGNEAMFAGVTISGVSTIDLTAGTAATIAAGLWSSDKVDLGFDNGGNAITVGADANYEVTLDQTTGLDFDFAASANGNVTVTAGDDNGTSSTVGEIELAALDAVQSATSTGTLTIEASIANVSGTTITTGAAQNIIVTGDEDLTFTGVVTGASFDASASSGIMTLSGLTTGVTAITTGGGNDAITINSGTTNHAVVTNAGNDTVTITATGTGSVVTGAGGDTINLDDVAGSYVVNAGVGNDTAIVSGDVDAIIVAGDGTDILRIDGTAALNNNVNLAISGFETLDLDAALSLSAAQWANNNVVNISTSSSNGTLNLMAAGTEAGGITIDASGLTADAGTTTTITISGTASADNLTGSNLAETYTQTAGNDSIEAGSTGLDTITLLANATDVDGTLSGDVMNGNVVNLSATAIDEATVTSQLGNHLGQGATSVAGGNASFSFASGTAATVGSTNIEAVQTFGGIENVIGGTGEDYIVGSSGANVINGNGGDDYINAGDGDDTVTVDGTAEYAADVYVGGLGNDTIAITATTTLSSTNTDISGFENITIAGASTVITTGQTEAFAYTLNATGIQVLTTGAGNDTINMTDAAVTSADKVIILATSGNDTITGFDTAEDLIDVDNVNGNVAGTALVAYDATANAGVTGKSIINLAAAAGITTEVAALALFEFDDGNGATTGAKVELLANEKYIFVSQDNNAALGADFAANIFLITTGAGALTAADLIMTVDGVTDSQALVIADFV